MNIPASQMDTDDNPSQECNNNNSTQKKINLTRKKIRKETQDFQVISEPRKGKEVVLTASTFQTPSSSSVVRKVVSEKAFPQQFLNSSMFDGKYFKIIRVQVLCQLCLPSETIITGCVETHFVDHLKQSHSTEWAAYTKYKIENEGEMKFSGKVSTSSSKLQQTVLSQFSRKGLITQEEFNKRTIHFIINTFPPLSTIDVPSFKELFVGFNVDDFDYKSAMNTIQTTFKSHQNYLKQQISQLKYLCCVLHIRRSEYHNYMGVTLHWLNEELHRVSVALAFQRFNGRQNIEEMLECIYAKYGIKRTQMIETVTYGGLEFKNFAVVKLKDYKELSVDNSDGNTSEYDSATKDGSTVMLPKYVSCVCETLNLIGNHCMKYGVPIFCREAMAKCRHLYNIIIEDSDHLLRCSSEIGWKFYFEVISQLLRQDTRPKLDDLNQKLLRCDISKREFEFLEFYWQLMKPLNNALNILQGETSTYFGFLLPTLIGLAIQWKNLKTNFRTYKDFNGDQMLNNCLEALLRRFAPVLELQSVDAIIAAVACPKFKLHWFSTLLNLKEQTMTTDSIKQIVISTAERLLNSENSDELEHESDTTEEELDDYFNFMNDENNASGPSTFQLQTQTSREHVRRKIEFELLCYLEDRRTNWKMLEDYPIMKEIFVKFNTPLVSSASVQRLLSFEETSNSSGCHGLTDENIERAVLLKINKIELN